MSYRQDLEAAHRRIAALEAALIERDGSLSAVDSPTPTRTRGRREATTKVTTPRPTTIGERIRGGWPVPLLVGLAFWFWDLTIATPSPNSFAKSSYVLFGIFGALILVGRLIANIATGGRSTTVQRIMAVVGIPLLIPAAFASLDYAGMGFGALLILTAAISGAATVIRWVRLGPAAR